MKIIPFLIAVVLFISVSNTTKGFEYDAQIMQIDSADTVFFNFDQVTVNAGIASFPVSIKSDDTIYALDFSFRYNVNAVSCDTIIELANYIESDYFYNSMDSTMRYTSYSLQPYSVDTALMMVSFDLLGATVNDINLFNVEAFLNGSACPVMVFPFTTAIGEKIEMPFRIYPNPARDYLIINTEDAIYLELFNSIGQQLQSFNTSLGSNILDVSKLPEGTYYIKAATEHEAALQKFIRIR
jgi:hypothetical protein